MATTWEYKLKNHDDLPKFADLKEEDKIKFKCNSMIIVHPMEVYEMMMGVPKGKLLTVSKMREVFAKKHNAECACPFTTGIFVGIAAKASLEMGEELPYHRTLKKDGEINPKLPGFPDEHIALLEAEGFEIYTKGRKNLRYFVKDYEKYLID